MNRAMVIFAVLLALLWQSLTPARAGSGLGAAADLGHVALHWQGEKHHHHDGGSPHVDDSTESVQHLAADHAGGAMALLPMAAGSLALGGSTPFTWGGEAPGPHPFLDGLLRPPRPAV